MCAVCRPRPCPGPARKDCGLYVLVPSNRAATPPIVRSPSQDATSLPPLPSSPLNAKACGARPPPSWLRPRTRRRHAKHPIRSHSYAPYQTAVINLARAFDAASPSAPTPGRHNVHPAEKHATPKRAIWQCQRRTAGPVGDTQYYIIPEPPSPPSAHTRAHTPVGEGGGPPPPWRRRYAQNMPQAAAVGL